MKTINIESNAIVVFIGAMGVGKSTYANTYLAPHDIVSSDFIRQQLSGDFEDQTYNDATFEILYATIEARAKAGIFTVIDSTGSRSLIERARTIAKQYDRPLYAVKFPHLLPEEVTPERMQHRMKYIEAYYRQVERINKTKLHSDYTVIEFNRDEPWPRLALKPEEDIYQLDPTYEYVVVPDLHGEYRALGRVVDRLHSCSNLKAIILGDIVDRGESSYNTFNLVQSMVRLREAIAVRGNHDNKFYRYLKKWLKDDSESAGSDYIPAYGMKIAHGLETTLKEFFDLSITDQSNYALNFIDYYENYALPYLKLEREGHTHYFSHAGVTRGIVEGRPLSKGDESVCLYGPFGLTEMPDEAFAKTVYDNSLSVDPEHKVSFHVGHYYKHDEVTTLVSQENQNRFYVRHDVGLGKRTVDEVPDFHTV